MASNPIRDPLGDYLLTPQNAALVVIDYQPLQFAGVRSMDRDLLRENIVSTDVATGRGQPTVPELAELLEDNPPIDRTTTNAWEDAEFLAAVRAAGTVADVIEIVLTERLLKA
jgi:nicotinamidase-related amidase